MPFALLIFAVFERLVVSRSRHAVHHALVLAILLTLIRIEGVGWALVIGIRETVAWYKQNRWLPTVEAAEAK